MKEIKAIIAEVLYLIKIKPVTMGLVFLMILGLGLMIRNYVEIKKDFKKPKVETVKPKPIQTQLKNVKTKKDSINAIIYAMPISEQRKRANEIYAKRHPELR